MPSTPVFAVIGAGMAGMSCATELQAAGVGVCVFDKSRGVGGRMSARREGTGQWDHGAQYFTASTPEFTQQVERWLAAGVLAQWQPQLAIIPARTDASSPHPRRYVGVPAMNAPARHLATRLPIECLRTVDAIRRDAQVWQIHSAERGWHEQGFAGVVLAMPAPQAADLLRPAAPELAAKAGAVVMTPCWAAMLQYENALSLPFDAAFVNQGPLRWVARNASKPGRNANHCWVLHASAEWSTAHEDDSPDTVLRALLQAFSELGAPPPIVARIHRWRYANLPTAETAVAPGMQWHADLGLGMCGDWLHGGKVEGAWLSGRALGRAIAASPRATHHAATASGS
ncbi:FAD-dependent oxidoreductase [Pandoraea sp.]|uniref:NAD(P)/FAD-dependent oxidoreductase n=1 Tax=Pandoraea sp. TaxID=1883445 RepID=UPI00120CD1F1|nr:FAD-dependent oxidoreductase [Pandoraea sp.]TAL55952.1 MAG: FAD-binding protein [Pandoraea sp.]TAM20689.1 MAG: FAD-binding protein [Pandoraea sp.]